MISACIVFCRRSFVLCLPIAAAVTILSGAYAHAARGDMSYARVERSFLEGNYDAVVDGAEALLAARSGPRDELYYLAGTSQLKLKEYAEARTSFQEVITKHGGSRRAFDAYVGVGDAYFLEGDAWRAIRAYDEALARYPDDRNTAIVYYRLADAYAKAGNGDKAQYYFESARMVSPLSFEAKHPPAIQAKSAQPAAAKQPAGRQAAAAVSAVTNGALPVSIQVGSFKSRANAESVVAKLAGEGFDGAIEQAAGPSGTVYRVKVGHFAAKSAAQKTVARLRGRGYNTSICIDDICD